MKPRIRWQVPVLLLSLFAACVLSACGNKDEEIEPPPEPELETEEGVLIYAALNPVPEDLNVTIKRFNLNHEDVRIEIRDYSDEAGMERLFTELSLGQVPDIMEMHYLGGNADDAWSSLPYKDRQNEAWMPYRQMVQKGYLEDLWPYIENDPYLGLDAVLMPPLKAAEVNGGLYMIFPEVSITTLMGPEHIVGDRQGWTLDELRETYSTMPEGSTILRYNATKRDMFTMLCAPLLEQYVDMETGETSFDSQGFRDMVEFLDTFPDEFKTTLSEEGVRTELVDRILSGHQMLDAWTISNLTFINYADLYFGAPADFIGYPTVDGSLGSYFNLHGSTLAMSSTCRNKEVAWEFMRKVLTKLYDANALANPVKFESGRKISINRKNYDVAVQFDLTDDSLFETSGGTGATYADGTSALMSGPLGERLFELDMLNETDLARFEALLNNTTQIYWPDSTLSDIVWESIGPYFARDKSMDDVIQMVQNRVTIYVNENR